MGHPMEVQFTARCENGHPDAMWYGKYDTVNPAGGGTAYEVACDLCDGGWTVTAQAARRAMAGVTPVLRPEPLPALPSVITSNPLWRLLNAALNRRAA